MTEHISPLPVPEWQNGLLDQAMQLTDGGIQAENNVYGTLANYPSLFLAWLQLGAHVYRKSTLPEPERELVIVRATAISRGQYPLAQHLPIARDCGLGDEQITAVLDNESAITGPLGDLVIATDQVLVGNCISETVWLRLQDNYSLTQCMDVVATAAFYRLASWFLNICRTPLEPGKEAVVSAAAPIAEKLTVEDYHGPVRIPALPVERWPETLLAATAYWPRFRARPEVRSAGVYGTFANHADLFSAIGGLMAHILEACSLPDRDRELVIVRACARARGAYPYRQHVRIGREAGLEENELMAAAETEPQFSHRKDQLLVDIVDSLVDDNNLDDPLIQTASAQLTMEQLMDTVVITGFYSLVSAMLNVARTPLEEGNDNLPNHFYLEH